MKTANLTYHKEFPWCPISGWAGARRFGWVGGVTEDGQWKRPKYTYHPFASQRPLWCKLTIHFQGVELVFAMPAELDQFMDVLSQNPMPSGHRLLPGWRIGRPNTHWSSRLPKKAKSNKFRQAVCRYIIGSSKTKKFRAFYAENPVQTKFEGIYACPSEVPRP